MEFKLKLDKQLLIGLGIGIFIGWFFNKELTMVAHWTHFPRPMKGGLGE